MRKFYSFGVPFSFVFVCLFFSLAACAKQRVYFPDLLEIREALRSGHYDVLEKRINAVRETIDRGERTDKGMTAPFYAFDIEDIEFEASLSDWVAKKKTANAYVARCVYYRKMGWESRGGKVISETGEQKIRGMQDFFALAIEDCSRAVEIDPKYSIAYAYMINMFMGLGEDELKYQVMKKGLAQVPDSFWIHHFYLFSQTRRWGGSIDFVRVHVQRIPDGIEELRGMKYGYDNFFVGMVYEFKRDYDTARSYFEKAAGDEGGSYFMYTKGVGDSYFFQKRYSEAVPYYEACVKDHPYFATPAYRLGYAYYKLGQHKKAMEYVSKAYEIDPSSEEYRKMLFYLRSRH